jgi:DNA-directed RNA polymerase subunit L
METETWTLTNKIENMLMTWERKIMTKTYGPTKKNGQWRIKTNSELTTKYKSQDIVTLIKIRSYVEIKCQCKCEWLRYVIIMNETKSVKIFEGKLEGRKGRGRSRLMWINNVKDM